jgi:C_GCAxxG_C_C family probable redox protein
VAVGTVHGEYTGEPHIDFERLTSLHLRVPVPLVLHGSSGTGGENLRRAVALGIRKINVFSDLVSALKEEVNLVTSDPESKPRDLTAAQGRAVRRVLEEYLPYSGSEGVCPPPSVDIPERARCYFRGGASCAESVYLAFAEQEGYVSDAVLQVCSMDIGGLCMMGMTCGTLLGALAVIGLRQSSANPLYKVPRRAARKTGVEFIQWFQNRFESTNCRDLLQLDLRNPVDAQRYKFEGKSEQVCEVVIQETCRWLLAHQKESN